jgi:hypothetical protein
VNVANDLLTTKIAVTFMCHNNRIAPDIGCYQGINRTMMSLPRRLQLNYVGILFTLFYVAFHVSFDAEGIFVKCKSFCCIREHRVFEAPHMQRLIDEQQQQQLRRTN